MDYEQKFILFKKLIDKTFSSYEKKYSVNFSNKKFVVKFILSDPERLINLTILPDSEWHEFKKQIEHYIYSTSFTECYICLYLKVGIKDCEKCSFTICDDCISEIILTNKMYSCPQCRYIPPHMICQNISTPRLSKIGYGFWAITNVRPPENYLSSLHEDDDDNFFVTDEWRIEMKNRYGDCDEWSEESGEESYESGEWWKYQPSEESDESYEFWGEPYIYD